MVYSSPLLQTLHQRGFLYQTSHGKELDTFCTENTVVAYVGFDATASSLQVGNLMMLMMGKWICHHGGTLIALVGGGTTKIGDPSWRDTMRPLLSEEQIQKNITGIKNCITRVVHDQMILVDNAQWLDALTYIPFLRDVGVHFSVNRMLALDHVKSRLDKEHSLSFIEFNYPLMQAYDFLELYKRYGCRVQFGGSDQWGNIITGVDLVHKMTGVDVYAMTTPLLTTASGTKMGKTAQGTVWLDPAMTDAYTYWQFWRTCEDADVIKFLKLYTLLPLEEIDSLSRLTGKDLNEAKIILADKATEIIHGTACLSDIHKTAQAAFGQGKGAELLPTYVVTKDVLLTHVLKDLGFVSSLSEAKRKIKEGAVRLSETVITEEHYTVCLNDVRKKETLVSLGHKKRGRLMG